MLKVEKTVARVLFALCEVTRPGGQVLLRHARYKGLRASAVHPATRFRNFCKLVIQLVTSSTCCECRDEASHMNFSGMHQWSFELDASQIPHHGQLLFGRKRHLVDLHTEFGKEAVVSSSMVQLWFKQHTMFRAKCLQFVLAATSTGKARQLELLNEPGTEVLDVTWGNFRSKSLHFRGVNKVFVIQTSPRHAALIRSCASWERQGLQEPWHVDQSWTTPAIKNRHRQFFPSRPQRECLRDACHGICWNISVASDVNKLCAGNFGRN